MAKLEALSSILSKFASITALNSNFTKITTAFDNTLSRDGSSPNAMEANIDMDSNRIINLPNPASNTEPVILGYFTVGNITDVDLTGIQDGDGILWDAANSEFVPGSVSGGGGGGAGTVTSVAISASDGIEVDSGSPITTSGTIAISLTAASQASLALADSATQPGDNVSTLTNDAGYITSTLTQEQVEDFVGGMLTGNTETLITVTYQDSDGTIDFVVDNDLANYDNSSSLFITASSSDTLTNKSGNISQWTNDAGYITATLTEEQVEDFVGGMVTGNTETLITVTYEDSDGTLDFVVDDDLSNYDNTTSAFLDPTTGVQVLTSAEEWFVNKSGSDSNDGLTTGTAFLTIQKAIDTVASYNLGGLTHNITIDDGSAVTYAEALTLKSLTGGSCIITGDETTPSNISIAPASGNAITVAGGTTGRWDVRGVEIDGATSGVFMSGGFLAMQNVEFAAVTNYQMQATSGANILFTGDYAITGGGTAHMYGTTNANITCNSRTITVTGTPNFSRAFAWAQSGSVIRAAANTYSGSATGKRHEITQNAVASTNGAASTYFPGNVAGTTGSGGQFV